MKTKTDLPQHLTEPRTGKTQIKHKQHKINQPFIQDPLIDGKIHLMLINPGVSNRTKPNKVSVEHLTIYSAKARVIALNT